MALHIQHDRPRRHLIRWIIIILLIALLAATGWYAYRWYTTGEEPPIALPIVRADTSVDESEVTPTQIQEYTVPAANPRYISIPSLGVNNTRVHAVGVTATNQLEAPTNINDAAWYNKSSTPGMGGAILIDAHNGGVTKDGVFAKIGTLQKGDIIVVERGDGKQFRYSVRENQSMPLEEVNATGMQMMMKSAESGVEGLNLITCDGKWVPQLKSFDRRIMLRAVLVE